MLYIFLCSYILATGFSSTSSRTTSDLNQPCLSLNHLRSTPPCCIQYVVTPLNSVPPAQPQHLGDEGEDVGVLLNGLGGGLAGAVPAAGVHAHQEGLELTGAVAHPVLQRSGVLKRVQRHHAVVVVRRQQQHGRVWRPIPRGRREVVERGVPGRREEGLYIYCCCCNCCYST